MKMNLKMKMKLSQYWKSIIVTIAVLYLSLAASKTFSHIPTFNHEDYLIHFLMYLGLTLTLIYDSKLHLNSHYTPTSQTFCIVFPLVLGGMLEIFQPIISARIASWLDFMFNTLGVIVASFIAHYWRKYQPRN
jgi:VanZ family protein